MIIAGLEFKPGKTEQDRRQYSVSRRFLHRHHSRQAGAEDVEVVRQFARSARPDRQIRRRRFAIRSDADRAERTGYSRSTKNKSRKAVTSRRNSGTSRVFVRCMARAILRLRSISRILSIYAVEVLARLNETIDAIETAYREYQFNTVAQRLYDFVWSDYCDWFVEAAKTDIFGEDEAQKEIGPRGDGFCALGDSAVAPSVHAAHHGRALVVAGSWRRVDSIRRAAGESAFGSHCRPRKQTPRLVSAIYGITQAGRNLRASR